jgi:hypothetical protein
MISWKSPDQARLLETVDDIFAQQGADALKMAIARPMNSDHVAICPFIDPFQ